MKVKLSSIVLYVVTIFVLIFFCSCSLWEEESKENTNNNITPPNITQETLLAPYITSFHSYMSWSSVSGATYYEIYKDGNYLESCTAVTYYYGDLSEDSNYYVVACNENFSSEPSNTVIAYKTTGFSESEVLDLSEYSSYSSQISADIRKVIIQKNGETFYFNSSITSRDADLIFELENVTVVGSISTYNGSYSRLSNNYNFVFYINGECSVTGRTGADGQDFSAESYNNTETDAPAGSDGSVAVIAPTLLVKGNGTLSLKGGDGGDGGVGSSTTTWSGAVPGKGADGGDGGAAILASYLIVDMQNDEDSVVITDGIGGKKGSPGTNGSIITGSIVTAMWSDIYDIGTNGSDGSSIVQVRKIIKGRIL